MQSMNQLLSPCLDVDSELMYMERIKNRFFRVVSNCKTPVYYLLEIYMWSQEYFCFISLKYTSWSHRIKKTSTSVQIGLRVGYNTTHRVKPNREND